MLSFATVNYLDLDAQPQKALTVVLEQTVDGAVKDERTTDGVNAQTFCLVKSA